MLKNNGAKISECACKNAAELKKLLLRKEVIIMNGSTLKPFDFLLPSHLF
jgi:hypothetical protein